MHKKIIRGVKLTPLNHQSGNITSHKLIENNNKLIFTPRINKKTLKIIILISFIIFSFLGMITLFKEDYSSSFMIAVFCYFLFYIFRNGEVLATNIFNKKNSTITTIKEKSKIIKNFNEVSHIEIIDKISGIKEHKARSSELNIAFKNKDRVTLSSGSNIDLMFVQAIKLSNLINCQIKHDDTLKEMPYK